MVEQNETDLIDITELIGNFFKTVKKFWIPMGITTLVLAVGYFLYSWVTYVPHYQSQVTFTVNTQDSALVLGGSSGAKQIKESLPYILKSQYMKNLVMEDLEMASFPATIELESKELANFFVLKITSEDPNVSYDILNSMIEKCPRASVYVLGKISLEILDETGIASNPINYLNKRMSLVKGAVLGVLLCAALTVIYILTNRTIQKEEDLKNYLSVSCLASLPQITFKKRRKEIDTHVHIHNEKVGGSFLEMVRTMRTRVQRAMDQLGAKTILVTSSVPEEGKSTVAANLALALAEKGSKVILVDLDLRNPSTSEVLGLEPKTQEGVVDILKGNAAWNQLISVMKKWNLHVLFGGRPESNTMNLVNSEKLAKMISQLRKRFDYVVLDTPPAAMLSDASAVAKYADCAVYVVKQDYARVERISEGMEALNLAGVPIIGVVLNGMESVIGRYGGYYSYRYGNYGVYGAHKKSSDDDSEFVDLENPWEE